MGWTQWRKIADHRQWYREHFDHGRRAMSWALADREAVQFNPITLERPITNRVDTMLCKTRLVPSRIIDWHLKNGWCLFYRARCCATKEAAKQMQDNLLRAFRYDWNVVLNRID